MLPDAIERVQEASTQLATAIKERAAYPFDESASRLVVGIVDQDSPETFEKVTSSLSMDFDDDTHLEQLRSIQHPEVNAETYSFQDDKLKTEEDNRKRLAEIEKNKVRETIQKLREDFFSVQK